jgi:hypothetical protein
MLRPDVRKVIRLDTRDRILIALPVFISALDQKVAAIKAEEKGKADWAAAIVEIFVGIAAPVFARLLVNRGGVTQKLAADLAAITKTSKTAKHVSTAKARGRGHEEGRGDGVRSREGQVGAELRARVRSCRGTSAARASCSHVWPRWPRLVFEADDAPLSWTTAVPWRRFPAASPGRWRASWRTS